MSIRERIEEEQKRALKAGDKLRLGCLRMLRAKMVERELALRAEHGRARRLDDEQATEVIAAYAKQRRESVEAYRRAGRDDLADREQAELEIVGEFLPRQLTADEIREIVREEIERSGASGVRDLGKVMKLVLPRLKGAADGRLVSGLVREMLESG